MRLDLGKGTVSEAVTEAKAAIDAAAGRARARYITVAEGQAETYLSKAADSEAFRAAGHPELDLASYPWVEAEALAGASTGQEAADYILATRDGWLPLGTAIEKARMQYKRALTALDPLVATHADVAGIRRTAIGTLDAI